MVKGKLNSNKPKTSETASDKTVEKALNENSAVFYESGVNNAENATLNAVSEIKIQNDEERISLRTTNTESEQNQAEAFGHNNENVAVNKVFEKVPEKVSEKNKPKIFQKFSVRDIVFLAVVSAVMIATCGVMALVSELTKVLFGIAQLVTGLQMSLFVTVGLMKVRKPFAMTLMLVFMGAIMAMMSLVMTVSNVFIAFVAEALVILVFRGYHKNIACFTAGALIAPLGLIVPVVWNSITAPEVIAATTSDGWIVFGMTVAVVAVSCLGAFLGVKIGRELEKAGVLKKNGKA